MRVAVLENNVVVNVIEADQDFLDSGHGLDLVLDDGSAEKGMIYNGETFENPPEYVVFLEIALSGGDGRNDPIGIYNDGTNKLSVYAELKDALGNVLPVTTSWRFPLRHSDGSEYETLTVAMTSGVINFDYYTSNIKNGIVNIDQLDFTSVIPMDGHDYKIRPVGDLQFKVTRQL